MRILLSPAQFIHVSSYILSSPFPSYKATFHLPFETGPESICHIKTWLSPADSGSQNDGSPQNVHILSPEICECATLHDIEDFVGVIN